MPATPIIEHAHLEAHNGNMFYIGDFTALSASGTLDFLLVTPPAADGKYVHLLLEFVFQYLATIEITEGVSTATDGTLVPSFCSNRIDDNTATALAYSTPTTVAGGTLIRTLTYAGGGETKSDLYELVLKPGTKYFFKLTDQSGSLNKLGYDVFWYERALV